MGELPLAETGLLGVVATLMLALTQVEEQIPFSALTKQLVVDEGETEIEIPVPTAVPPQVPEYQCHVAPTDNVPVNVSVENVPEEHKNDGEAFTEAGAVGVALTFIITLLQLEKHPLFSART